METNELIKIKTEYLNSTESKLKNLLNKRSNDENKIKRLQENLSLWNDFLTKEVNKIANDFVKELNSDKFNSYSLKEREEINDSFRIQTKELISKYNRKILLNK